MIGGLLRYCITKIEFSPSFLSDLLISTAYVLLTAYLYVASAHVAPSTEAVIFIAFIALEAQTTKVVLMFSLDWRGGDASSKRSRTLVTSGVYAYSRNPAYLVTIVQNVLWSLLLLLVIIGQPTGIVALVAIFALPVIHFFVLDRIVRREEVALSRWHPAAYAAYAGGVNRWFGRRRPSAHPEFSTVKPQRR